MSNYAKLTAAKIDLEELKAASSDPGSADPTPDKPESDDNSGADTSDTSKPADNPDTGSALPVAGAVVAVLALGAVITLRKKAK